MSLSMLVLCMFWMLKLLEGSILIYHSMYWIMNGLFFSFDYFWKSNRVLCGDGTSYYYYVVHTMFTFWLFFSVLWLIGWVTNQQKTVLFLHPFQIARLLPLQRQSQRRRYVVLALTLRSWEMSASSSMVSRLALNGSKLIRCVSVLKVSTSEKVFVFFLRIHKFDGSKLMRAVLCPQKQDIDPKSEDLYLDT